VINVLEINTSATYECIYCQRIAQLLHNTNVITLSIGVQSGLCSSMHCLYSAGFIIQLGTSRTICFLIFGCKKRKLTLTQILYISNLILVTV